MKKKTHSPRILYLAISLVVAMASSCRSGDSRTQTSTPPTYGSAMELMKLIHPVTSDGGLENSLWHHINDPELMLEPGGSVELANVAGPGVITHFHISDFRQGYPVEHDKREIPELEQAWYRDLILEMVWDQADEPQVRVPLGAFFGVYSVTDEPIPGLMMNRLHRACNSYWPMPFRKRAEIRLHNTGTHHISPAYCTIQWRRLDGVDENLRYFHAHYHAEKATISADYRYPIMETDGAGHFVGLNVSTAPGMPVDQDLLMYINGENTPRYAYLGMEDYFGHSWGFGPKAVMSPLSGLTYETGIPPVTGKDQWAIPASRRGSRSRTSFRHHVVDPIGFDTHCKVELSFDDEWIRQTRLGQPWKSASVAYWYQAIETQETGDQ